VCTKLIRMTHMQILHYLTQQQVLIPV